MSTFQKVVKVLLSAGIRVRQAVLFAHESAKLFDRLAKYLSWIICLCPLLPQSNPNLC
jgi:hypothetical protein